MMLLMKNKKHKPKPVRLDADATGVVCGLADITGRSESFIASLLVKYASQMATGHTAPSTIKRYLDGLVNVRTAEKVGARKIMEARKAMPRLPGLPG